MVGALTQFVRGHCSVVFRAPENLRRALGEWFGDPTVAEHLARVIRAAPKDDLEAIDERVADLEQTAARDARAFLAGALAGRRVGLSRLTRWDATATAGVVTTAIDEHLSRTLTSNFAPPDDIFFGGDDD